MTTVKIKKQKLQKSVSWKEILKFENYKNFLEATQLENNINYSEKNEINKDSSKKTIKNS